MSNIILKKDNSPDTIEELAKFVLVGRDAIKAVQAQIRMIEKLEIAQEVRNQKREELSMMSDVLLDAEVRLGELMSQLPKNPGARTDMQPRTTNETRLKEEVIRDLGFSKPTAHRLEILAQNKDIVEFVKAEARENGDIPTRARVLELAAHQLNQEGENENGSSSETKIIDMEYFEKKREAEFDEYDAFIDLRMKAYRELMKIIDLVDKYDMSGERMDSLRDNFDHVLRVEDHTRYIEETKNKLTKIQTEIRKPKKHRFSNRYN
jgi:hypothetical protein